MVSVFELGVYRRDAAATLVAAVDALFAAWRAAGPLARGCIDRVRAAHHGDLPRWLAALNGLPEARPGAVSFGAVVTAGHGGELSATGRQQLGAALRELRPWRKGPFSLFGIHVDAEWRSDLKWARIAAGLAPTTAGGANAEPAEISLNLDGRRVLDVGCGNGYYGWRMLEAGARSVVGIDPSLLFTLQHAAVGYYAGLGRNLVLPLHLEEVEPARPFDVIFSMGVIYHRRDPAGHLRELARFAHRGTTLVLESLVSDAAPIRPRQRYARMRNVHVVPDLALLHSWLAAAGFPRAELLDISTTSVNEQRATDWMPFQSLAVALDPADPGRTVEGYPAPRRAVIIAKR